MRKTIFKDTYKGVEYKIYFQRLFTGYCSYIIEIYKGENQFMNYTIVNNAMINFKNNTKKMRKLCYEFYLKNREHFDFYINNLDNSRNEGGK